MTFPSIDWKGFGRTAEPQPQVVIYDTEWWHWVRDPDSDEIVAVPFNPAPPDPPEDK